MHRSLLYTFINKILKTESTKKFKLEREWVSYEFHRYIYNIVDMYLPPYLTCSASGGIRFINFVHFSENGVAY